jgi:uncharacterized membrane protein (DUF106 family)
LITPFVSALNRGVGGLLEAILLPLDSLSPLAGVAAVSVLVTLGMLIVFKVTSNQREIEAAKRAMQAGLFEMRLFNADLQTLIQAQVDVLAGTLTYLRLSAIPVLWMLLPLVLVTAHLQSHYGYQGLNPGESALVKVRMKTESEAQARSLALDVPPGLREETPMVWVPSLREASWRIGAEQEGGYVLDVTFHGARFSKTVLVSGSPRPRSPIRPDAAIFSQLRRSAPSW